MPDIRHFNLAYWEKPTCSISQVLIQPTSRQQHYQQQCSALRAYCRCTNFSSRQRTAITMSPWRATGLIFRISATCRIRRQCQQTRRMSQVSRGSPRSTIQLQRRVTPARLIQWSPEMIVYQSPRLIMSPLEPSST
jgi:hypothetical protein